MDSQNTPSPRKNSSHLSRDQRLQVLTLHKVGQNRKEISDALGITIHQVIYTIRSGCVDPGKHTGRISKISPEQGDELEKFVCSSRETRQMSYLELAMNFPQWNFGEDAVRNALRRRGYSRCIARNKPPLSAEHRRLRLEWAERHKSFNLHDWCHIIWSDETWINDGPVNKTHVTRKEHEEYDITCIKDRYNKNNSWMFWGCFAGVQVGPSVFWQKNWNKMTGEGYCERILPEVVEFFRSSSGNSGTAMQFMHDNAPVHTAAVVKEYLGTHGIEPMAWPPYSPDLNPIENIWGLMKSYIHDRYGDSDQGRQRRRAEVQSLVQEAWQECTSPETLTKILSGMHNRCLAVIRANGGSIGH